MAKTINRTLKVLALLGSLFYAGCASQGTAADYEFWTQASEVYPAKYRVFVANYIVESKYGDILEAAQGTTPDGKRVLAVLARGSTKHDPEGAQESFESQIPNPYRILIVIDEGTHHVVASKIVRDGTTESVFTVPQEKLDAYKEVAVTCETAFDGFSGGLVTGKQFDIELDALNMKVVSGTSLYYTGATVQGTYSSQLIRNCFMTAARFYVNTRPQIAVSPINFWD